ncbi:hypothetical protein [Lactiplantibacillus paraxiangfangensis]|uniref:hypothetical protein n=1 Tax=Lactiplantibacillus paraxiangfangensis TaxID=3076224 RepID=UPI0030C67FD3
MARVEFKLAVKVPRFLSMDSDTSAVFWWDTRLHCDNDRAMEAFKQMLLFHVPQPYVEPGTDDFYNDIEDGPNAYNALTIGCEVTEIMVEPSNKFMGTDYPDDILF